MLDTEEGIGQWHLAQKSAFFVCHCLVCAIVSFVLCVRLFRLSCDTNLNFVSNPVQSDFNFVSVVKTNNRY